ncbi:paraquat-inducible protein A [Falsiroseomonas bella]|uniref:Paraquat-inducible protein A n=1 Tax=Falsiroseomonas bella TaxID=2184016 RepID=A0A317FD95_9PROT|nr:paraquat-inducible protein A [Falsiroseomonas bella]PWS36352.1 paraquat-inducible protein A [Falsiroseomonas bella]
MLIADSPPAHPAAEAEAWRTPARLCECASCGRFQTLPSLLPGQTASCLRCGSRLRRAVVDPIGRALALNIAALSIFAIAWVMTLMTVSTAGMVRDASLFTGPVDMGRAGLWELTIVVLFTTVVAPVLKLFAMVYVLAGLRLDRPPRHIRRVFALVEHLRPWSMIEVFLLGVAVAYTKLVDLVHIELGVALYALFILMLTMIAAEAVLDRQAVWEEMERRGVPHGEIDHAAGILLRPEHGAVSCHTCGLVGLPHEHDAHCPRCGSRLHARKPNAVARAWALLIAAAILYIPANYFPVLAFIQLGSGQPSTILGGVVELLDAGLLPLALLVFFASVAVPLLKVLGLGLLLGSTQAGWRGRLRDRTRLYFAVHAIGRWSMIDIFMVTILVALVRFGAVVSIQPGYGGVAFCAVVILTMIAAESFDPRLMWDAAGENPDRPEADAHR